MTVLVCSLIYIYIYIYCVLEMQNFSPTIRNARHLSKELVCYTHRKRKAESLF